MTARDLRGKAPASAMLGRQGRKERRFRRRTRLSERQKVGLCLGRRREGAGFAA